MDLETLASFIASQFICAHKHQNKRVLSALPHPLAKTSFLRPSSGGDRGPRRWAGRRSSVGFFQEADVGKDWVGWKADTRLADYLVIIVLQSR